MAPFNGKWRLVSSENAEEFFAAVKASDEFKQVVRSVHAEVKANNPDAYVEEIHVDKAANTIHRIAYIKGEKKKDSGILPIDVEFDGRCHGKPAKMKVVLPSDNKMVRHEKGEDFTSTMTIEVHDCDMTVTLSSGSVTSTEKYKRV